MTTALTTTMTTDTDRKTKKNLLIWESDLRYITEDSIHDFIIEAANKIDDVSWHCVGIALGLITGRRMGEVHGYSTFEPVDDTHVMFINQLKTKMVDTKTYIIPVTDTELVIHLEQKLRLLGRRKHTLAQINHTISPSYNRNSEGFTSIGLDTFRDTRIVYTLYHNHYTRPDNYSRAMYTAKILGYNKGDAQRGRMYEKFEFETFRRGIVE